MAALIGQRVKKPVENLRPGRNGDGAGLYLELILGARKLAMTRWISDVSKSVSEFMDGVCWNDLRGKKVKPRQDTVRDSQLILTRSWD